METAQAVRQEAFENLQLQIIEENGEEWFSAEDIGKALGLTEPRIAVIKIFNRNRDEFEGLYRVTSLVTWLKSGGKTPRRFTTFNPQGAYLLAILARTPKSKALRRFLHDLLKLKEHVGELEAQHLSDQSKIGGLTKNLKARRLAAAPKALPAPELPEMKNPVLVDFTELRRLYEYGSEGFSVNFLHEVLNRNAGIPTFHLEVKLPGAHRPDPFLILSGVAEAKFLA